MGFEGAIESRCWFTNMRPCAFETRLLGPCKASMPIRGLQLQSHLGLDTVRGGALLMLVRGVRLVRYPVTFCSR